MFTESITPTSSTSAFKVGQRVTMAYYARPRAEAAVMEIDERTGAVRVQIDMATMHEWVRPEVLTPLAAAGATL